MLDELLNHIVMDNNEILLEVLDEDTFLKEIDKFIKNISLDLDTNIFLVYDNLSLFHNVLKRIILSYIIKNIDIKDNKHYKIKFTLNKEVYNFLVIKIANEKLGTGYGIDFIYF